jgi:hypothetical protein
VTRGRLVLGVALVVFLAVGISVVLASRPDPASRVNDRPTGTPSTPVSPTPSPSPSVAVVPTPQLTGENFDAIVRAMEGFRAWLYEHPDPSLLAVVYDPDCWCYRPEFNYLKRLKSDGWRFDDEGTVILSVDVLDRPQADMVVLAVTNRHGPERVVNAAGKVVQRGDGWPKATTKLTFKRGSDGRWRLFDVVNPPS